MSKGEDLRKNINNNNFLLRGSSLRISEAIEVLVIFTGKNCKIY